MQRLKGPGFDTIPSAQSQAEQSDAKLTANAARWGRQLDAVGIDANLAPVADVVPADLGSANAPIGLLRRGYGSSPRTVAAKTSAFVGRHGPGRDRHGGQALPGAGPGPRQHRLRPPGGRRPDHPTGSRRWPASPPTIDAGVDMVMVSSAYYAKIDAGPSRRRSPPWSSARCCAATSDFAGVVISDDLAAAAMSDLAPGTAGAAVRPGGR